MVGQLATDDKMKIMDNKCTLELTKMFLSDSL